MMRRRYLVLGVCLVAVLLLLVTVVPALAASDTKPFSDFINNLIKAGQGIAGVLAILMLIFGAIKLKTASGNPQSQQQAKITIGGAAAGLLLVVFARDIVTFITHAAGK